MIIGTLLVRDESEIVEQNIEHHLNNGIDALIVTNNLSEDDTEEKVLKYKEVIHYIKEDDPAYNQREWVTRMAHIAAEHNPEWIIHIDADEFWTGLDVLKEVPEEIGIIISGDHYNTRKASGWQCREYMPVEGMKFGKFNVSDMVYYRPSTHRAHKGCKIIHRPTKNIKIWQGNHGANNFVGELGFTNAIQIDHYPIRSFEHFLLKVHNGGKSYENSTLPADFGWHWRKWYESLQSGNIKKEYDSMLLKDEHIDYYLSKQIIFDKKINMPIIKSWELPETENERNSETEKTSWSYAH